MKMKKYICFVLLLICLLPPYVYAQSVSSERGQSQQASRKSDIQRSKELSKSDRINHEIKKSIEKAIQTLRNQGLKKITQEQLSIIKEKSKMLSIQQTSNLSSELMQIAYHVLKKIRYGDEFTVLFENLTPSTFGISSHVGNIIDFNRGKNIQQIVANGGLLRNAGANVEKLKTFAIKAIYLSTWLADCVNNIKSNAKSLDTILQDAKIWLRHTAYRFVNFDYNPSDKMYKQAIQAVWHGEARFKERMDKYQIGPGIIDLEQGVFCITVAGRPYLTNDSFAGVTTILEYAESYSFREMMQDLQTVEQFKELSKSISDKIDYLKAKGKVKEATRVQKTYMSWINSISNNQDFAHKLTLLLKLLGI